MDPKKFQRIYILADIFSAFFGWLLFDVYLTSSINSQKFRSSDLFQAGSLLPALLIIVFWLLLYHSTGYYNNVFRKLRLEDFGRTFTVVLFGSFILFFGFFVKEFVYPYRHYLENLLAFFVIQFHITLIPRLVITSYLILQERKGKVKFRVVLIGQTDKISHVLRDLNGRSDTHVFLGYINIHEPESLKELGIKRLGGFGEIHDVVKETQPDDVIIALDESQPEMYRKIIYELNSSNVVVKVNPELYSIVQRQAIISSLFRYPLIEVSRNPMKPWQASLKQLIDILFSLVCLVITSPLSIFLAITIKLTSKGPVFYSHERTGRFGKSFKIYKFRSMYFDAETNGPQLSSRADPRITKIGGFMRRFKLDEIPNFVNVLRGEMSLVGPRPERKFYIEQIVKQAPEYTMLFKIKPGVTSWGQVKYGYAESVDEMIRRMRYDLLYVANMSLYVDFQILARTFLIILRGNVREK